MGERPRLELFAGLAALYQTRDYSDLVLFGREGTRHPVHRAVVCPRSEYFHRAVRERKWRDGIEGHLALPDDDEVVRLLVEYLYLLEYQPIAAPHARSSSSGGGGGGGGGGGDDVHSRDSSDTMSVRTEAGQYGHVYGTSAISAFGGPQQQSSSQQQQAHHGQVASPFSAIYRSLTDSSLTADFANFSTSTGPVPRRRPVVGGGRGLSMGGMGMGMGMVEAPEPSPLASKVPHLVLHARLYAAAYKYSIDGLKALALDKFKIQLTRHWDSPELAEAIHVVYSATPDTDKEMREAVADALDWHGGLLDKPEIEVAIMEINGLAYELLKRSRRAEPEYM